MTRESLIASMRAMLDHLEKNPEIPLPYFGSYASYVHPGQLASAVKALGAREKTYDETDANFIERFGDISLNVFVQRDAVCQRKVVGQKLVKVRRVKEWEEVDQMVDEVQWDCAGSALGDGK